MEKIVAGKTGHFKAGKFIKNNFVIIAFILIFIFSCFATPVFLTVDVYKRQVKLPITADNNKMNSGIEFFCSPYQGKSITSWHTDIGNDNVRRSFFYHIQGQQSVMAYTCDMQMCIRDRYMTTAQVSPRAICRMH